MHGTSRVLAFYLFQVRGSVLSRSVAVITPNEVLCVPIVSHVSTSGNYGEHFRHNVVPIVLSVITAKY